jgi:hypothetical protein
MTSEHEPVLPPGAGVLAGMLQSCEHAVGNVLSAVAGGPVDAELLGTGPHELTGSERLLLLPAPDSAAYRGTGLLRTRRGVPVADVTATVLPARLPRPADPEHIPWPGLLREDPAVYAGARRRLIMLRTGRGYLDAGGWPQLVRATALLSIPGAGPAVLLSAGYYTEFTDMAARL